MRADRARGSLVSKCHRCGASLTLAPARKHAVLQGALEDLSAQVDWPRGSGRKRDVETWWELGIMAFDRLKKDEVEMLPALDGKGFDGHGLDLVRGARRRRHLGNVEISEVIEHFYSIGAELGVTFRDFSDKRAA